MTVRHHDYDQLEKEYLREGISIRELCRRHHIASFSTVAAYAREHGWAEKRDKIVARTEERMIDKVAENLSDQAADQMAEVRKEMLTVVRAALYKFAEDLKNPDYKISVPDLIKVMNQGLLLMGEPTIRTEDRTLALTGNIDGLPPEFLRRLADASRPADGRGASPAPRVVTEGPRQN